MGKVKEMKGNKMKNILDDNILICPECKGINLHQDTVSVYNCYEDKDEGTHVDIDWDNISIDKSMIGNPSPRRHGLSIHFSCETCEQDHPGHILNIYQHKGSTVVEWEK